MHCYLGQIFSFSPFVQDCYLLPASLQWRRVPFKVSLSLFMMDKVDDHLRAVFPRRRFWKLLWCSLLCASFLYSGVPSLHHLSVFVQCVPDLWLFIWCKSRAATSQARWTWCLGPVSAHLSHLRCHLSSCPNHPPVAKSWLNMILFDRKKDNVMSVALITWRQFICGNKKIAHRKKIVGGGRLLFLSLTISDFEKMCGSWRWKPDVRDLSGKCQRLDAVQPGLSLPFCQQWLLSLLPVVEETLFVASQRGGARSFHCHDRNLKTRSHTKCPQARGLHMQSPTATYPKPFGFSANVSCTKQSENAPLCQHLGLSKSCNRRKPGTSQPQERTRWCRPHSYILAE